MKQFIFFVLIIIVLIFASVCSNDTSDTIDTTVPRVVETFPQNGSQDVDPSITELYVVFDEEMMPGSMSWAYDDVNSFPVMTGQPYFNKAMTKNTLPVKMKPNTEYIIWFNSPKFPYFKDKSGNVLVPFRLTFKTR